MESPVWSKEIVWVARDSTGNIIRASDDSPVKLLQKAEELRLKVNGGLQHGESHRCGQAAAMDRES